MALWVGDVVRIRPKERVPADCVLVNSADVLVETKDLDGETSLKPKMSL